MPWPSGSSGVKEPITSPFLSMWIIDGGRVQQSPVGGFFAAWSSRSLKSFGRSSTQTLSSLSTASPVTPPNFQLFGRGLGQSGSNLYLGGVSVCAPTPAPPANKPQANKPPANKQGAASTVNARLRTITSRFIRGSSYPG